MEGLRPHRKGEVTVQPGRANNNRTQKLNSLKMSTYITGKFLRKCNTHTSDVERKDFSKMRERVGGKLKRPRVTALQSECSYLNA